MVINLTDLFTEMRRRRTWERAGLVPSIDPTGVHMRTDEYGRLICFEDYGQMDIFGWLIVEQLPVNHRSCWLLLNYGSGGYKSRGFQSMGQRTLPSNVIEWKGPDKKALLALAPFAAQHYQ
ncbi:MAG: hypothetical protein M3Q07_22440 [Pseudobdellovibrionaceae bacterium]|nr:hypothetical protein [Pseudobdellovibrionaceae bacterium]